jgi:hypothetical protein
MCVLGVSDVALVCVCLLSADVAVVVVRSDVNVFGFFVRNVSI